MTLQYLILCFAEEDLAKRETTKKLFQNLPTQAEGIFISKEVVREISKAEEPKRRELEGLLMQN